MFGKQGVDLVNGLAQGRKRNKNRPAKFLNVEAGGDSRRQMLFNLARSVTQSRSRSGF